MAQVEESEKTSLKGKDDLRKLRQHKRIDRNPRFAKAAKLIHVYTCQACGFNFEKFYGSLGKKFIEAHHLTPISELKGQVIELDALYDFAVLCSNCHSMIHKFDEPHNLEAFKKNIIKHE